MFLLLPTLALLVGVSFASASQITLSHTDTSNPLSFHAERRSLLNLSLIHISEPTRPY